MRGERGEGRGACCSVEEDVGCDVVGVRVLSVTVGVRVLSVTVGVRVLSVTVGEREDTMCEEHIQV